MADFETVADGLRFPEGPVAMPDGSVILTEIEAGRITRVAPDGSKTEVATTGGGPNGLVRTESSIAATTAASTGMKAAASSHPTE
jgi:sugar lactone lactonase YvrE